MSQRLRATERVDDEVTTKPGGPVEEKNRAWYSGNLGNQETTSLAERLGSSGSDTF